MNATILEKKWMVLLICFATSLVSMALFSISTSPLTPFEGLDVCVFKQMGGTMLQGKIPYYDLFDHKGPVIYFINALGLSLTSGRIGMFSLVTLNCAFVLFYWYKTALNFTDAISSFLAAGLTLLMYLNVMEEGAMTEDWSLLPLSYSLYLASCKLAKNQDAKLWQYLLVGVFAGMVMMIRANNLALLVCAVLYLSYRLIVEKKCRELFLAYLMMALGCVMILFICTAFFYFKYGFIGVEQMIYGTLLFNLEYSSWNSYYDFFISSMVNHAYFLAAIVLVFLAYTNNKVEKSRKEFTLFVILCFLLCLMTMGRTAFRHYLITVVPLYALSSSYALKKSVKSYTIFIAVTILISEPFLKKQVQYTLGEVKRGYVAFYDKADRIIQGIGKDDKNNIWNYNAEMTGISVLQHNNIIQSNRVILNFQRNVSQNLRMSENGRFQRTHPKFILLNPDKDYVQKGDSTFIANNYCLVEEIRMDVETKNSAVHERLAILKHK